MDPLLLLWAAFDELREWNKVKDASSLYQRKKFKTKIEKRGF